MQFDRLAAVACCGLRGLAEPSTAACRPSLEVLAVIDT
jgi:hypothetical protein